MCTNPLFRVEDLNEKKAYFYPSNKEMEVKERLRKNPANWYSVIDCGNCTECRIKKSKEWAERCMNEMKYHNNSEMLTLTYDNEHVPKGKKINKENGEIEELNEVQSLNKKDAQDFLKRLRKKHKIRYFMCGEYGDKRQRPHIHLIAFGLKIDDKEFAEMHKDKKGQEHPLFKSKEIEKIWGKGRVRINEVNKETIEYVARYVMKKWKGENSEEYYENLGIIPEYCAMSNRPGIGYNYIIENKNKILNNEKLFTQTKKGIKAQSIPRYYKKVLEREEPEKFEEWKKGRKKIGKLVNENLQILSNKNIDELREQSEQRYKNFIEKRDFF